MKGSVAAISISDAYKRMPYLIGNILDWPTQCYPDHVAIGTQEGAITYSQLCEKITLRQDQLESAGITRGSKWGLAYADSTSFLIDLFALWKLHCVAAPLRNNWLEHEQQCSVALANLDGILRDGQLLPNDAAHNPKHESTRLGGSIDLDPALILWTSGSTGTRRGVLLQHHALLANINSNVAALSLESADRTLVVLRLSHAYPLIHQCLCHLAIGATVFFPQLPLVSTTLCRQIDSQHITTISVVPAMLKLLIDGTLRTERKCTALRLITIGAASATREDLMATQAAFPHTTLAITYGLTEAGPRVTTNYLETNRVDPDCVGTPLPNVAVSESSGNLLVHTRAAMQAYIDEPESPPAQLKTGDRGSIEDGTVRLRGRTDNLINRGGILVSPRMIESVIRQHEAVTDCQVLRVAHPIWGEAPLAHVQATGLTSDTLMAWCTAMLAPEERPIDIVISNELAAGSGKTRELCHQNINA